ncbi:hypothetical protein RCL1_007144 [Eukaryota sp. TZLM3-RCL]
MDRRAQLEAWKAQKGRQLRRPAGTLGISTTANPPSVTTNPPSRVSTGRGPTTRSASAKASEVRSKRDLPLQTPASKPVRFKDVKPSKEPSNASLKTPSVDVGTPIPSETPSIPVSELVVEHTPPTSTPEILIPSPPKNLQPPSAAIPGLPPKTPKIIRRVEPEKTEINEDLGSVVVVSERRVRPALRDSLGSTTAMSPVRRSLRLNPDLKQPSPAHLRSSSCPSPAYIPNPVVARVTSPRVSTSRMASPMIATPLRLPSPRVNSPMCASAFRRRFLLSPSTLSDGEEHFDTPSASQLSRSVHDLNEIAGELEGISSPITATPLPIYNTSVKNNVLSSDDVLNTPQLMSKLKEDPALMAASRLTFSSHE